MKSIGKKVNSNSPIVRPTIQKTGKSAGEMAGKPTKLLADEPRLRRASLKQNRVRSLAL